MSLFRDELPVGDVQHIKNCLELADAIRDRDDVIGTLSVFFSHVVAPFYDCMWDGMSTEAGHTVYRLSDQVPCDVRARIDVYPGTDGWHSLEDFRREWEQAYPVIPERTPLLEVWDTNTVK